MNEYYLSRRRFLQAGIAVLTSGTAGCHLGRRRRAALRLATFAADVTPPLGHPLMGGGIERAKQIVDPLSARGCVLLGADKPLVLCVVEWCEIRNDAYDRWRESLAEAAGTTRERVLVTCTHVHDAPIADLTAQRLLESRGAPGSICDLQFHEQAVRRVARAVHENLATARAITHVGTGQSPVERIASNRRFVRPDGTVTYERMSSMREPAAQAAPEGTIDPQLKTLSFWHGSEPLLALSVYATHPMSYYGKGGVSDDFVGLARRLRQVQAPDIFQLYGSGCSGNVVAGKYNDGSPENRPRLAHRLCAAMTAAWRNTQRHPLEKIGFRCVPLSLPARDGPGFTSADLEGRLAGDPKPFRQCLAALGLSWRRRCEAGQPIDLPAVDFGAATLLVLPGETYVEYQLLAQQLRPERFVVTLGYGESGPGYIPIERAVRENDGNLRDWSWVGAGCEPILRAALIKALGRSKASLDDRHVPRNLKPKRAMALFGSVEELLRQARPGTRLARGLAYLKDYRAGRLPELESIVRSQKNGDTARVDIEGDKLFVTVQCYAPRPRELGKFEAHQQYTDLQYLCEGQEYIEVCDLQSQPGLAPYDASGNVFFPLGNQAHSRIRLQAGRVAVLFPNDAHAPCLRLDGADGLVRKLVVKVQDAEAPETP